MNEEMVKESSSLDFELKLSNTSSTVLSKKKKTEKII